MDTYKSGEIFHHKRSWLNLRLPKKWILGSLAVFFLALFALSPLSTSATKVIKAQDYDANGWQNNDDLWWNKDDCNGSEAPYQCKGRESYPVAPIDNLDPLPTLPPEDPYPAPNDNYNTNPSGIQQASSAIIQIQQQIQNEMVSCVQKRTQGYNHLAGQYRQYHQLQAQLDNINNAISRTTDDKKINALQKQADQIQQDIDRINDTIANTQNQLDDTLAACRDRVSDLQSRQDDLEANLANQFNTFLDYDVPDYPYNPPN